MTDEVLDPPTQEVLRIVEEVRSAAETPAARAKLESHADEFAAEFPPPRRDRFVQFVYSATGFLTSIEINPKRPRSEFAAGWEALKRKAARV